MTLEQLLNLRARLDDLLLPWWFDPQLNHLITHAALREHNERAGWGQKASGISVGTQENDRVFNRTFNTLKQEP